ncbi:MAG: GGDEF domain-containing protein [Gammaproteobacteria bacterium]|nr:GGDEF domain-containing protein [Gammaproteobacteria bacterium]
MAISTYLADVWSATEFGDPELSGYAEEQLREDTRVGVQTMAALALAMQLCVGLIAILQGLSSLYVYTGGLFALLSLHILISASFVKDIRALHTLGMAFLIIGAVTVTVLAHRSGDLNIGMMAAVVMLLVAVPLVPWALREAAVVVGLTYVLLTLSLVSVPGRFEPGALLVLQTLIMGAAIVVIVVTGRNTFIRKQDIRTRFELENAHSAMELLSMQDHLTGAWNRRYLDENFDEFARQCIDNKQSLHLAVLDIDDFKGINDKYGHQVGDRILINVADTFIRLISGHGRLVRLGGDEFLIIYCGDDLDQRIDAAVTDLQQRTIAAELSGDRMVSLSAGIASTEPGELADLGLLYRNADQALYAAKQKRPVPSSAPTALTRTGTWKL